MVHHFNPYVDTVSALKRYKNQPDALLLMQWLVVQVKPIMKAHGWRVPVVREFFPRSDCLLGLNLNRGAEIRIRLRPAYAPDTFYPTPDLIHTMLHELTHNLHSAHDATFFRFLDGLRDEYDALRAKGWRGEGFFAPGQRLGASGGMHVRNPPEHVARRLAVEAAEKRGQVARVMLPAGGRKLGGPTRFEMLGKTPQQMAAYYAERRARDNIWCGETHPDDDDGETPQSKAAGGKDELSAESLGVPTLTFADFGSAENPIVIGDDEFEPFSFQGASSSSSSSPAAASLTSKSIIKQEEGPPVVLPYSDEDEHFLPPRRPISSAASTTPTILTPRKRPSSSASSSSPSSSPSNPAASRSHAIPKRSPTSSSSTSSPSSSTRKKSRTSPFSSSLPSSTLPLPPPTPPRRVGFFNTMLSPSPSRNVKPSSVTRNTYGDWSPFESSERAAADANQRPRVGGAGSSGGSAAGLSSSSSLPARKLNFGSALGHGGSPTRLSSRIPPPPPPPLHSHNAAHQQPTQHWACQICTFHNENPIALACYACGSARANNDDAAAVAAAVALLHEEQRQEQRQQQREQERPPSDADEQWQCPKCTKLTSTRYRLCMVCDYMRPSE
ncbi:hypothetical protein HDU87_007166 [Geranomyces variabilis]|uniref:WLM domain-containing protein n=1 Tax=Geranomyces variabilis TaxID=109894 RepID=A0AAD5TFG3_9FUNG|nr:hypothetical protein HDU87_007166 [Geranomyces variabilis]